MSEKSLRDQFNDYPDFKKVIIGNLNSTATNDIVKRLEEANVSFQVCNLLIDDLEKSMPQNSLKDYLSTTSKFLSAILAAFAIQETSGLEHSLRILAAAIILGIIGFFLQNNTLLKHDLKGYLKALRIYRIKLTISSSEK